MKRSIIEENSQIPEMYMLRHKHDVDADGSGYNYTDNIFKRTMSPILFRNDNTEMFLDYLSKMFVTLYDHSLPVRNLFFYTHDKYFNKHGK